MMAGYTRAVRKTTAKASGGSKGSTAQSSDAPTIPGLCRCGESLGRAGIDCIPLSTKEWIHHRCHERLLLEGEQ